MYAVMKRTVGILMKKTPRASQLKTKQQLLVNAEEIGATTKSSTVGLPMKDVRVDSTAYSVMLHCGARRRDNKVHSSPAR